MKPQVKVVKLKEEEALEAVAEGRADVGVYYLGAWPYMFTRTERNCDLSNIIGIHFSGIRKSKNQSVVQMWDTKRKLTYNELKQKLGTIFELKEEN